MKKRVMIGIIAFDGLVTGSTGYFLNMMFKLGKNWTNKYYFELLVTEKREQHRARNSVIEAALAHNCDYVWMIDDDTIVRENTFEELIKALENDDTIGVIGALYVQRSKPYNTVLMSGKRDEQLGWCTEYIPQAQLDGSIKEVAVTGGGCFMFSIEPFKNMIQPYFDNDTHIGTDVSICLRLKDMGYKVLCHTGHEVGHISDPEIIYPSSIPTYVRYFNNCVGQILDKGCEQLEIAPNHLADFVVQSSHLKYKIWNELKPKSRENLIEFYRHPSLKKMWLGRGLWYNCLSDSGRNANLEISHLLHSNIFDKRSRVLDFGSGIGLQTLMFHNMGFKIYYKDIQWYLTQFTKSLGIPNFKTSWRKHEQHGTIILMDVIEHLNNPMEELESILWQLKYGGYLITNFLVADFNQEQTPEHLCNITKEKFLTLLKKWDIHPTQNEYLFIRKDNVRRD